MRAPIAAILAATALSVACSSSTPGVAAGHTTVDATYSCPAGASDARYQVHATSDLHNATSSTVTIRSVTVDMTLKATQGTWGEKVGDRYDAGSASFTPASIAAGRDATLNVTITSACTNTKTGTGGKSYGEYQVTLHIDTSAGTITATSANLHRIIAA